MLFVPAKKPRSVWRTLILLFAAVLTLGVLAPVTASAHGPTLLRAHDTTVTEGDLGYTAAHVKISLNQRVDHQVSVGWYTKSGTARAWRDFKPTAGRAYIPKLHKAAFALVLVKGDKMVEPDEFFFVNLVNPRGAGLGYHATAKVTILNDDRPMPPPEKPKLLVRDLQVGEAAGPANIEVLLLTRGHHPDIGFDFATADSSAKGGTSCSLPGVDYVSASGHAVIRHWQNVVTVPVTICDDAMDEPDQAFLLRVSGVDLRLVEVLKSFSHVVIVDNDAEPNLAINNASVTEGMHATLTVILSAKSDKTVTVNWATADGRVGGATSAHDYTAAHGTLTFVPGDTREDIVVATHTGDGQEGDEVFFVDLSSPTNATINQFHPKGTVTILANRT